MKSNDLGKFGESYAESFLKEKGYTILIKNYKTRLGEIDIIAKDKSFLVFVEVKLRNYKSLYAGVFSVNHKKIDKIIKSSLIFMMENEYDLQPRFDVIDITTGKGNYVCNIEHYENAF
ncbi:MAG: YraN family protein [Oscillospiraceae bacterium]